MHAGLEAAGSSRGTKRGPSTEPSSGPSKKAKIWYKLYVYKEACQDLLNYSIIQAALHKYNIYLPKGLLNSLIII